MPHTPTKEGARSMRSIADIRGKATIASEKTHVTDTAEGLHLKMAIQPID
jgi:hypothetical protein